MGVISNDQLKSGQAHGADNIGQKGPGRVQQEGYMAIHITFIYQDFASVFQSFELQDHFKQVGIGQLYDTQHVHNY